MDENQFLAGMELFGRNLLVGGPLFCTSLLGKGRLLFEFSIGDPFGGDLLLFVELFRSSDVDGVEFNDDDTEDDDGDAKLTDTFGSLM